MALYRASGSLHVLALSGLHVSILFGAAAFLLLWVPDRRWRVALGAALLFPYLFLAGWSPSLGRAVIMLAAGALGYLLDRDNRPWTCWPWLQRRSCWPTRCPPRNCLSSFLFWPCWGSSCWAGCSPGCSVRRCRGSSVCRVAVSLGAQAATTPLLLATFGAAYPGRRPARRCRCCRWSRCSSGAAWPAWLLSFLPVLPAPGRPLDSCTGRSWLSSGFSPVFRLSGRRGSRGTGFPWPRRGRLCCSCRPPAGAQRLNYDSPAEIRGTCSQELGMALKKRWGQNFLVNRGRAGTGSWSWWIPRPEETVWEIGPGLGCLTAGAAEAMPPGRGLRDRPRPAAFPGGQLAAGAGAGGR